MTTVISITDFKKHASIIMTAIDNGERFALKRRDGIIAHLQSFGLDEHFPTQTFEQWLGAQPPAEDPDQMKMEFADAAL